MADPCYTLTGRWKVRIEPGSSILDSTGATTGVWLTAKRPLVRIAGQPTATLASTLPRRGVSIADGVGHGASGTLTMIWGCVLPGGEAITNLAACQGSTAIVAPTHQWFTLHSSTGAVLAASADDTSTAWTLNTIKSLFVARPVSDAAITSGTATLTSATAAFTTADTGRAVTVIGAGVAGAPLGTSAVPVTMTYVDATTVTLSTTASTTVSGAVAYISTPYTPKEDTEAYFGICTAAGTVPTFRGQAIVAAIVNLAPVQVGTSTTSAGSLTTPPAVGANFATPSASTLSHVPYAYAT